MPVLFALPPTDPGFELFVASQGVSQGLAQTQGPQVIPRALLRIGPARVGAQWRNIDSPVANGVAAFFVRYGGTVAKTEIEIGAVYRLRTGAARGTDATAWELAAGARRSFGAWGLRINAEYSPDEFGKGQSLYVEWGPTFALSQVTQLSANAGRRERQGGPNYWSFNAGVSRTIKQRLSLDGRFYGTDRASLDAAYGRRVVLSARLML